MLVMAVILIAPATITSCVEQANATEVALTAAVPVAELSTDTLEVSPAPVAQVTEAEGVFSYQNIILIALALLSTVFATLWRRASAVIHQIDEALKDGKIDKAELNKIIQAWKG